MSETPMSPEAFATAMRDLKESMAGDPEALHVNVDKLMCDLLRSLGYEEGVKVFDSMRLWYA